MISLRAAISSSNTHHLPATDPRFGPQGVTASAGRPRYSFPQATSTRSPPQRDVHPDHLHCLASSSYTWTLPSFCSYCTLTQWPIHPRPAEEPCPHIYRSWSSSHPASHRPSKSRRSVMWSSSETGPQRSGRSRLHRTTYGAVLFLCFVLELKQPVEGCDVRRDVPLVPPATY